MMFGGSDAPCASAFFMSIGKISPEENKTHAAAVYPIVSKYLGVPEDRMYVLFHNATYSDVPGNQQPLKISSHLVINH